MHVSLVVNPAAGGCSTPLIETIKAALQKRSSLTACVTTRQGDAFDFAQNVINTDRIVVAGGDGTINEVINGMLSSEDASTRDTALCILPMGTANVLAKETGIPEEINGAIERVYSGTPHKISLGRVNGRYFALMAGIGFDGQTVLGVRHNLIKKISGKLAHVVSGLKVLAGYNPDLVNIILPEKKLKGYTVIVGNAKCYGGHFYVTPKASLADPHLDMCLFQGRTRPALLRFIYGVLRQNHLQYNDVQYMKVSELRVQSEKQVHVQIDGEYFGTLPVNIEVVKDALNLVW